VVVSSQELADLFAGRRIQARAEFRRVVAEVIREVQARPTVLPDGWAVIDRRRPS